MLLRHSRSHSIFAYQQLSRLPCLTQVLDDLLLPIMDEAVRRDILTAQAYDAGDYEEVQRLVAGKSRRQELLEAIQAAEQAGNDEYAERLRNDLDLATELRADFTQDEGSYSRFLDKDEWYEAQRRRAMGLDK